MRHNPERWGFAGKSVAHGKRPVREVRDASNRAADLRSARRAFRDADEAERVAGRALLAAIAALSPERDALRAEWARCAAASQGAHDTLRAMLRGGL